MALVSWMFNTKRGETSKKVETLIVLAYLKTCFQPFLVYELGSKEPG